jgi:hypothetical protein
MSTLFLRITAKAAVSVKPNLPLFDLAPRGDCPFHSRPLLKGWSRLCCSNPPKGRLTFDGLTPKGWVLPTTPLSEPGLSSTPKSAIAIIRSAICNLKFRSKNVKTKIKRPRRAPGWLPRPQVCFFLSGHESRSRL